MFYEADHLGSADYLRNRRGRDLNFPPHLHQSFELVVLLRGDMTVTVDGKRCPLSPGESVLVFPNQIHALETQTSECIICIFSPLLVQAYTADVTDMIPEDNRFRPEEHQIRDLDALTVEDSQAEKKAVLYSLCARFHRTARYESRQSDNRRLLYTIFRFVENHYAEDCSLKALSREMGYDYAYLSRYFARTTGIPFNTYVNHYRLSQACYLMKNTSLPLIRCAQDSGFPSLRSFNRIFRAYLGVTPSRYRSGRPNE